MHIVASVTFVALLSASTVPALADQFEWGPLTSQPLNDQNTFWDAHCGVKSQDKGRKPNRMSAFGGKADMTRAATCGQ